MGSGRAASLIGHIGSRNAEPPSAWVVGASHGKGQAAWEEEKLEDVACQKGSLFQVYDLQTGCSHPTSRSRLSLSSVSSQRDVKLQLVEKSTPVPVQGNLFLPCLRASASAPADARHGAELARVGRGSPIPAAAQALALPSALCITP